MSFVPKPHEIYKHFKGNLYQITTIAEHSETGELLVIYQALYGEFKTYARPLAMFTEKVDHEKYPSAMQEYRFELQGAEDPRKKEAFSQDTVGETGLQKKRHSEAENVLEKVETRVSIAATEDASVEEMALDPMLLEFLDADTYEERLNILAGVHHKITHDMITTMAVACDVEVSEGDLEDRYAELKNCLLTLERFECNRLR